MKFLKIMKIAFILFWVVLIAHIFGGFRAYSCENFLPKSQLELIASGVDLKDSVKFCKDLPKEECICYEGKDLRFIKLEKEKVLVPIYSKDLEQECKSEEDCYSVLKLYDAQGICTKLGGGKSKDIVVKDGEIGGVIEIEEEGWFPVFNKESMSVYCAKKTGEELKETGKNILVDDEDKKVVVIQQELEIKEQIEQDAISKQEAKDRLKSIDIDNIKDTSALKEVVKDILKAIKE